MAWLADSLQWEYPGRFSVGTNRAIWLAHSASIKDLMKILLYNPDNGVTRNFMPHLWMFLLQALTPPGHEVVLIDGNAQPMDEEGIARYVREQNIGTVTQGVLDGQNNALSVQNIFNNQTWQKAKTGCHQ
jgi:hypothetical protein